ncbi:hypothetical protein VHP8226_00367 [Vibrio hippocampi]|uniref:Uncharacterized protein n=1 Tax=Vibrio hippocampi TaxID=654686 RepID=A0ABM8ZEB2_9VIBR|nr:hypothetical protein VHP8226_00367 [Vibrio hippocampi]
MIINQFDAKATKEANGFLFCNAMQLSQMIQLS